jgi:hypothetical protein
MNRWRVGEDRGSKETDGCPLTSAVPATPPTLQATAPDPPAKNKPPAWKAFFEEREQQNAWKLEKEMSKQREAQLNCTHHPPTVSTQVFEWVESDSDPTELVQRAVLKLAREKKMGNYGES